MKENAIYEITRRIPSLRIKNPNLKFTFFNWYFVQDYMEVYNIYRLVERNGKVQIQYTKYDKETVKNTMQNNPEEIVKDGHVFDAVLNMDMWHNFESEWTTEVDSFEDAKRMLSGDGEFVVLEHKTKIRRKEKNARKN